MLRCDVSTTQRVHCDRAYAISATEKQKMEYGENITIDQRGAPRCIGDDAHDGQSIKCSSCAHRNAIDCNHATA
ncbi:hypothetical protein XHC_0675 [Xanthomonas hortorum pv. carotae str. M081]|nr:hypothetical protein XHC_0675 [Xanthomonas hortorum pv. carotae str. M081]